MTTNQPSRSVVITYRRIMKPSPVSGTYVFDGFEARAVIECKPVQNAIEEEEGDE